jgi:NAD(P)-dependent dehydrogenase (short-subunit alcohol dehydrogenase family)
VRIEGARAIVTGGASGIGAAVARLLGERGATAVVLDVAGPEGERALRCDVSDEAEVVAGVEEAFARLGGLDLAVLCAGVAGMSPILDMSASEWDRVMGVNLRGTFLCLRECARRMEGGSIVVLTSVSGFLADRRTAHYNASKAGADMLVKVAARELGPRGVRVNAVAPGTTDTPMFRPTSHLGGYRDKVARRTPLGGIGSPEQIAQAVMALAELDWVTGRTLVVDGGQSLYSPVDAMDDVAGGPTRATE